MKTIRFISILFILFSIYPAFATGYPPEPTIADLKECDAHFKYKGKLLNPVLIKSFEGWVSDTREPAVVSVDVAAAYQTEQFPDDEVKYKDNEAEFTERASDGRPPEYYGYRWIGRLDNGLHVIEFYSSGGGTMIAYSVFLVRCSMGKGWRPIANEENYPRSLLRSDKTIDTPYARLLVTIERFYIIGDRVATKYKIKGNTITMKFTNQVPAVTRIVKVE